MLCEKCQEREATVFITQIVDGDSKSLRYCEECAGESGALPWDAGTMQAMKTAVCVYCGGSPCVPRRGGLVRMAGLESEDFVCQWCMAEITMFAALELQGAGPETMEALATVEAVPNQELLAKLETHMKQWLAEIQHAGCRYCGGRPCSPGFDLLAAMRREEPGFVCEPCKRELHRFTSGLMKAALDSQKSEATDEQALQAGNIRSLLLPILEKAEEHMKAWVSSRDKPGDTK